MTIYNLGSINVDHFYTTPHIPQPGETLAATGYASGLGGKGANQSVAIAKSGGAVRHIGAVGPDADHWMRVLQGHGVDTGSIAQTDTPTGHAIITVAADGENVITLFPGANQQIADDHITQAMADISPQDWLLMQNETNGQQTAIDAAAAVGAQIAYSAAPFEIDVALQVLPYIDLIVVNEGEAASLQEALSISEPSQIPVRYVVVTLGSKGAVFYDTQTGETKTTAAISVTAVDTTGAGDTFLGYFLASLDGGAPVADAMALANRAAALKVTQHGTADAIPTLADVKGFAP